VCAVVFGGAPALAAESGHTDPIATVVLWLAVILAAAKIAGDLAVRIGQPAVLGELVAGVVLGNLSLAGIPMFEPLKSDPTLDMLARLGVLILLFEVGLESTVKQMMQVGLSSFLVAMLGVAVPFGLGWAVGAWLLPHESAHVHAFLGAALCATSVGITARVLKDLKKEKSQEARIILGAAVIDDVLGLVILAVVTGTIAAADRGGSLPIGAVMLIVGKALVFLVGSLAIGVLASPSLFRLASRLRSRGVLLSLGLVLCFLLSWLANLIGLAPIVGAFAAGLILESAHWRRFVDRGEQELEELVHPISEFLVPVFFVLMGTHTDLRSFLEPSVLGLAAALTGPAGLGQQPRAAGGVGRGLNRLAVGVGMIPRGEVGMIFANIGMTLTLGGQPVVAPATFSAVVVMVIVTTMLTPPALKWAMEGQR
jgi:Kef-type K+ transport system membrane component KefB